MRLSVFENYQGGNFKQAGVFVGAFTTMRLQHIYLPGNLSLANAYVFLSRTSATFTTTGNNSFSLGIYSLDASTLSLINSFSFSTTAAWTESGERIASLAISTVQDLSQGEYWLGYLGRVTGIGAPQWTVRCNAPVSTSAVGICTSGTYSGLPVHGRWSTSTSSLPSTVNITDFSVMLANSILSVSPYVILTA